jgi:hypothetical protein
MSDQIPPTRPPDNEFRSPESLQSSLRIEHQLYETLADDMNLLVKLCVVQIFLLPPITNWAGTQEEAKALEQPAAKTAEPWQITIGGPGWLLGSAAPPVFTASTPMSMSASAKFSGTSTLFIRSAAKFEKGDLVSWVTFCT